MNFRITTLFFGLLLTTLFIFGLMIAHKKTAGDQGLILPSISNPDARVDKIVITHGGADAALPELTFERVGEAGDRWFLKQANQQVRVEGKRIDNMVESIQKARHEESADVSKDLKTYGLDKPLLTITLSGKLKDQAKEWQFFVGKENTLKDLYYVNSSERQDRAFATIKRPIDGLFVKDANTLRQLRLFDFIESGVTAVDLKKGDKELELKRENSQWTFVKPPLGPAGAESPIEDKKLEEKFKPKEKEKPPIDSVKSLLDTIVQVSVDSADDFVPLGKPMSSYDLESKTAPMRIEIQTADDKKAIVKDILLVGKNVPGRKDFYFARLDGEDGVMMIHKRWIEPLEKVLQDPGKIRSRDIAVFDDKKIDVVVVKQKDAKEAVEFFKSDKPEADDMPFHPKMPKQAWDMVADKEKKKANEKALQGLIEQLLGKKGILQFDDEAEPDAKKRGPEWGGLDKATMEIAIYSNAVERPKKAEKDEKKEDKNEGKKEDKKDDKKDVKKDEKKEPLPTRKTDAKPIVKLEFGTIDKDNVYVRRTLENGAVSRFTMKKEITEKVSPPEGVELAYRDLAVPSFEAGDAVSLKLERVGKEPLELERRFADGQSLWHIKDKDESGGVKLADSSKVIGLINAFSHLPVKKWLKKLDDVDTEKYGFKKPAAVVTIVVKKDALTASMIKAKDMAGKEISLGAELRFGALAASIFSTPLNAAAYVIAAQEADKGETIKIELGNDTDVEKDKPGVFAKHSAVNKEPGVKLLFLVAPDVLKTVKEIDLRDRDTMLFAQPQLEMLQKANAAFNPYGALMFASPHYSGQFWPLDADKVKIDPDKVNDVRISVRTQFEFRSFHFERKEKEKAKAADNPEKVKEKGKDGKDKEKPKAPQKEYTWHLADKTHDFEADSDKIKKMIEEFAKLRAERFAAYTIPTGAPKRGEFKLGDKEYTLKIEFKTTEGPTITLWVGTKYQKFVDRRPVDYGHYAACSYWPETVFFLPASAVNGILNEGAAHFAKERSVAN